jgi:signal transduction histidine kinase
VTIDLRRAAHNGDRRVRTRAFERLRSADRRGAVRKLSSVLAHELGTPLNVITGHAHLITSNALSPEDIARSAKTIADQAERMNTLITELLEFARGGGVELEPVDLPGLLAEIAALTAPLIDERVKLVVDVAGDSAAVLDPGRVTQVITTLLANAANATQGEGTIWLRAKVLDIDDPPEKRSRPGRYVRIEVEDQGAGMATENLDEIFKPFFNRAGEHPGLGLSVSHGVVREHGGWIEVESKVGAGARFSVYFPSGSDDETRSFSR